MPGAHVGKGARLGRAIIEEGVEIPSDFQVGWDAEQDGKHQAVSPSGVVIVSETPKITTPLMVRSYREKIIVGFKSGEHWKSTRTFM
jgi:ADP-glucose pyrophosphorylase